MIVLDSSAWVQRLTGGAGAERVDELMHADPWLAGPSLLKFEVLSAVRHLARGRLLDDADALASVPRLAAVQVIEVPVQVLVPRIWELRHNLTTYDASYVAAAEVAGATLVTCDSAMASLPGVRCPVELVA